jgi:hypothetical protein
VRILFPLRVHKAHGHVLSRHKVRSIKVPNPGVSVVPYARVHRIYLRPIIQTLPQGLLGQAIDYALKRWEALNRFVDDGVLEIDNNILENSIRPSAIGKKNWLFIGHPDAGERSAVIYTLLGSCRRHGINPFDYLKDLFTRLPAAKITEIKEFTPVAWAKAKAKEKMVAQAA